MLARPVRCTFRQVPTEISVIYDHALQQTERQDNHNERERQGHGNVHGLQGRQTAGIQQHNGQQRHECAPQNALPPWELRFTIGRNAVDNENTGIGGRYEEHGNNNER